MKKLAMLVGLMCMIGCGEGPSDQLNYPALVRQIWHPKGNAYRLNLLSAEFDTYFLAPVEDGTTYCTLSIRLESPTDGIGGYTIQDLVGCPIGPEPSIGTWTVGGGNLKLCPQAVDPCLDLYE